MVVKLTGNVNGNDVIFQREKGDLWTTTIPPNIDGTYVVELTAVDDAGNTVYFTKYIVTFDIKNLCVKLQPYPYVTEVSVSKYYCILKEESEENHECTV